MHRRILFIRYGFVRTDLFKAFATPFKCTVTYPIMSISLNNLYAIRFSTLTAAMKLTTLGTEKVKHLIML